MNQTRTIVNVPRLFAPVTQPSTVVTPYLDHDSSESTTRISMKSKRAITTTKKFDRSLDDLLKTSQEFMNKVIEFKSAKQQDFLPE